MNGNTITDSAIQIGDNNELNIDFEDYSKKIDELKKEIKKLKLTIEEEQSISTMINQAENACKNKQTSTLKKALKGIKEFAVATGSSLLSAYLAIRFGIS